MGDHAKRIGEYCISLIEDETLADWFQDALKAPEGKFHLNFGLLGRRISRILIPNDHPIQKVLSGEVDIIPTTWTLDEVARLCLILSLDVGINKSLISTLLGSSDMREQIVIYKALPFLLNRDEFTWIAADGIRTNMTSVFDAIALRNNFPSTYFSEEQWNQMVLKAIFMERPLFLIRDLEHRKNEKLAQILHDFVHERWSAGRSVTPELWRLMDGYVDPAIRKDLIHELKQGSPLGRRAAFKAIIKTEEGCRDVIAKESYQEFMKQSSSWDEIGIKIIKGQ